MFSSFFHISNIDFTGWGFNAEKDSENSQVQEVDVDTILESTHDR